MAQNIEKVIQRGERLDDLVDKTDELNAAVSTLREINALAGEATVKNVFACLVGRDLV